MELKFYLVFITGLIPLIVGMVWYNKAVFGSAWMKATGMTEEKGKSMNMIVVFILTYIFGVMISIALTGIVIHQMGFNSVFQGDTSPESKEYIKHFFDTYGGRFRSFKHGVLHGVISGLFVALPIIAINAMFELRGFKYIAINTGYWIVCLALIGGVICQFA